MRKEIKYIQKHWLWIAIVLFKTSGKHYQQNNLSLKTSYIFEIKFENID
jgi:hypothetical protein